MKNLALLCIFAVVVLSGLTVYGQDPTSTQEPTQQPTQEELDKQKAELSKNAYRLLDQVVDEAQSLHLIENRVRVQITAADMLWDQNQSRARTLFNQASDGVADLMKPVEGNTRRQINQARRPNQLRQQLVLTAARHDASLAYQLMAATRPATPPPVNNDPRNPRANFNAEDNLEQSLLAQVAALDPKLAAQNADQMLEKGQFPRSIVEVIAQLQRQDKDAAAKLTDKTLKRLQSANLLTSNDAGLLALNMLTSGPRLQTAIASTDSTTTATNTTTASRSGVLEQSAYTDLLSSVIDSALKATPQSQNQRVQFNRGRGFGNGGAQDQAQNPPTDAQIEQNGARRLLGGLQTLLPQIDQYLPSRAQSVRQKMTEMGMGDGSRVNLAQTFAALQQGNATTESIMQAAATAPPQMQARMYQQAANKALDDGDINLARQIASDHLQDNARDVVMQRIDFREMAKKAESSRLDEIRQNLARVPSENDRIDLLIQMSNDLRTSNPKLSLQLLEEAKQITSHRATNYDHFEEQLKVARAFAVVEPARSFDIIDPAISQLNELLSAAAMLNGFEVNIFRDGELPLQSGSGLTSTISRFGEELARLARNDFGRAETLAGRFQSPETRTLARLAIVQGLLGVEPPTQQGPNFGRGFATFTFRDN